MRIPFKGDYEHDALSRKSRKYHKFRPGVVKYIKRQYNKRFRKLAKEQLRNDDA